MPRPYRILDFLDQACAQIQRLEHTAKTCVDAGQTAEYVRLMHEKAHFLAALSEEGQEAVHELPAGLRERVAQRLERFSRGAAQALQLDSTFYMSALLFPEEHKAGEPHDLEVFRDEVRRALEGGAL